jgi:diguanylate cyclase
MLSYKKEILYPLVIASLLISIVMMGLFYTLYQLNNIAQSKDHIDTQRFNINLLRSTILEAETSQRGYLLTNNVTFLEHYEESKLAASKIMGNISHNSDTLPELARRIKKIFLLCEEKLHIIEASLNVQLNAGAYASHLTLSKDRGKSVMEEIIQELNDADSDLMNERKFLSKKMQNTINSMIAASVAMVLGIFGILIFSYLHTLKLFKEILSSTNKVSDLNYQATHDPLTNLLNRRGFEDRLQLIHENTVTSKQKYAIFYMDLDKTGDALLIAISRMFQSFLRESDCLARLGGDEFALIVQSFKDQEELTGLANRLIYALQNPITVEDKLLNIGVSIGVAIYKINGFKPEKILAAADSAMYLAKKSGKNQMSFVR